MEKYNHKKWMIPAVAGLMALSLVGCGTSQTDSQSMNRDLSPTRTSTYETSTNMASDMMSDAHYYASRDGQLPACDDMTRQGCEMRRTASNVTGDVERAMRDVGKSMDQVIQPSGDTL